MQQNYLQFDASLANCKLIFQLCDLLLDGKQVQVNSGGPQQKVMEILQSSAKTQALVCLIFKQNTHHQ